MVAEQLDPATELVDLTAEDELDDVDEDQVGGPLEVVRGDGVSHGAVGVAPRFHERRCIV